MQIEARCCITGVDCRPWRDSTNDQRLDGETGLLLTPSVDHLFERGFIGFEDSGDVIISPVAHLPSLERMGIESTPLAQGPSVRSFHH